MKNINYFKPFMYGVRMIMLTHRSKEGGKMNQPDRVAVRRISKNQDEFMEIFNEFTKMKDSDPRPLRIYSSVNPRNVEKAIMHFKHKQLDADYYDEESRHGFYYDIKNRWISALMQRSCKAGSQFLIDIDEEDNLEEAMSLLKKITLEKGFGSCFEEGIYTYPTKHGFHIVTPPFNPQWMQGYKINPDGLLLLDW